MKKILVTAALVLGAGVCLVLYLSVHDTFKAGNPNLDPDARLRSLRQAEGLYPWNEESFAEEGIALLSRGMDNMADFPSARSDILQAYQSLRQALRLNPGSAMAHFYYAKTLNLMKYLGQEGEGSAFQEFQNAARLAGPNRQLKRAVGMDLLNQ